MTKTDSGQDHPRTQNGGFRSHGGTPNSSSCHGWSWLSIETMVTTGDPPCLLGPHACHRRNAWSCTYHLSWGTRNGATRLLFQMCHGCQGQLKYFYGHPTIRIRFTIIWFDELLIPVMNMDWWPSSQYGCIIQVSTVAQMMMGIYWEHSPFSDTHTYIYILVWFGVLILTTNHSANSGNSTKRGCTWPTSQHDEIMSPGSGEFSANSNQQSPVIPRICWGPTVITVISHMVDWQ